MTEFLKNYESQSVPPFSRPLSFDNPATYILPENLLSAVKIAIFLGQPLLLTGEAGTGKTQLAEAVAYKYGLGQIEVFNTKTTSTAKDLLYSYDNLAHFQYVQINKEQLRKDEIERRFINYRALGKAIKDSSKRTVVLIDEVDKAPRDLPNDILDVLDKMHFEVPEIEKIGNDAWIGSKEMRPIVILTSNSEKNLPDAFLRRCVFFHIKFPDNEMLQTILKAKLPEAKYSNEQWTDIIQHFNGIREKCKRKQPATAELISWIAVLENIGFDTVKLKSGVVLTKAEMDILYPTYSLLAKNTDDLRSLTE